MKATELIKALADLVARNGDLEVYTATSDPGHYRKMHENYAKSVAVHPAHGKRALFVDAERARALGYAPDSAHRGITLG